MSYSRKRSKRSKRSHSRKRGPPKMIGNPCPPGYTKEWKTGRCYSGKKKVPKYIPKRSHQYIYNKRTGKRISLKTKYKTLSDALKHIGRKRKSRH